MPTPNDLYSLLKARRDVAAAQKKTEKERPQAAQQTTARKAAATSGASAAARKAEAPKDSAPNFTMPAGLGNAVASGVTRTTAPMTKTVPVQNSLEAAKAASGFGYKPLGNAAASDAQASTPAQPTPARPTLEAAKAASGFGYHALGDVAGSLGASVAQGVQAVKPRETTLAEAANTPQGTRTSEQLTWEANAAGMPTDAYVRQKLTQDAAAAGQTPEQYVASLQQGAQMPATLRADTRTTEQAARDRQDYYDDLAVSNQAHAKQEDPLTAGARKLFVGAGTMFGNALSTAEDAWIALTGLYDRTVGGSSGEAATLQRQNVAEKRAALNSYVQTHGTPVEKFIVEAGSSALSSITMGYIGGYIAAPIGAAVGAASGKAAKALKALEKVARTSPFAIVNGMDALEEAEARGGNGWQQAAALGIGFFATTASENVTLGPWFDRIGGKAATSVTLPGLLLNSRFGSSVAAFGRDMLKTAAGEAFEDQFEKWTTALGVDVVMGQGLDKEKYAQMLRDMPREMGVSAACGGLMNLGTLPSYSPSVMMAQQMAAGEIEITEDSVAQLTAQSYADMADPDMRAEVQETVRKARVAEVTGEILASEPLPPAVQETKYALDKASEGVQTAEAAVQTAQGRTEALRQETLSASRTRGFAEIAQDMAASVDEGTKATKALQEKQDALGTAQTKYDAAAGALVEAARAEAEQRVPDVATSAETGPIQAGMATTIKNPYNGPKPVQQEQAPHAPVLVDFDSFQDAVDTMESASGGEHYKSALKKHFEDIVGGSFSNLSVTIDGVVFNGKQYDVQIGKKVIGKVINDGHTSPEKFAMLNQLPQIVKSGEYVGSSDNVGKPNVLRYDYFETTAQLETNSDGDTKDFLVCFDVEVYDRNNRFRTYRINNMSLVPMDAQEVGTSPTMRNQTEPSSIQSIPHPEQNMQAPADENAGNDATVPAAPGDMGAMNNAYDVQQWDALNKLDHPQA